MRWRKYAAASCLAAFLVVVLSVPAIAAAKMPISGKLSKRGYTVIALAANGKATSVVAKHRKFKLRPPAKRVTIQLRAKDGVYAGPIVVGRKKKGKRAILDVRAGAKLGKIKVKARKGYAKVKRKLPKKLLDAERQARAKKGVPIGAGRFGRVRSRHAHGGAPGDRDLDGIPDPLDIDDDGDRILDNLDRSPTGGGARVAQGCGPNNFYCQPIASNLPTFFEQTVNVNAGSTTGQIDAALSSFGNLRFSGEPAELDCGGEPDPNNPDGWIGGLSYCTRGGTGGAAFIGAPGATPPPFPGPAGGQFDPDGDGFGTLEPPPNQPTDSFLAPRATTTQIKTGDVLTLRVTSDGTETQFPATLNYAFITVPALVTYNDTAGNSATVSYPVAPGDPGTAGNGFPVSAPAGQDVVLTLTFWRPQRQAIPGSDPPTAQWMDIGHLTYSAYAPAAGHPALAGGCPQATFSSTDSNLTPPSLPLLGTGGLADLKADQVSSPGNTLTYELNLSQCLAANGLSFNSGEEQMINFIAVAGATDTAEQQGISFKRQ